MVLADLAQAMERKDYMALSKCFTEDAQLFDYCPALAGKDSFHVCGRRAIEMFYHNRFFLGGLAVRSAQVESDREASLYISYGQDARYAVATIEDLDAEGGLIRKLAIRPA